MPNVCFNPCSHDYFSASKNPSPDLRVLWLFVMYVNYVKKGDINYS